MKFVISSRDKKLIDSVLAKVKEEKKKRDVRIMSFDRLFRLLSEEERSLLLRFRDLNPSKYGFKGRYFGIQKVPANLVAIRGQKYRAEDKAKETGVQYLPKPAFKAYKELNGAIYKDTGKKLLVGSGYRSPAYQTTTFLWHLRFHKFNFRKTVKRVAAPGYSEHGYPKGQAIDFLTQDGIPGLHNPERFAKTEEYQWLMENAHKFGFHLSYPRNNKIGIVFEPWHWQFRDSYPAQLTTVRFNFPPHRKNPYGKR